MEHKLQSSEWKLYVNSPTMPVPWSRQKLYTVTTHCLIHHTILAVFAIILMQKYKQGVMVLFCSNLRLHWNYFTWVKKRWLSKGGCTYLNVFTLLGFSDIIMWCQQQSSHRVYNKGRTLQGVAAPYRLPSSLLCKCIYFRTSSFSLHSIFATPRTPNSKNPNPCCTIRLQLLLSALLWFKGTLLWRWRRQSMKSMQMHILKCGFR